MRPRLEWPAFLTWCRIYTKAVSDRNVLRGTRVSGTRLQVTTLISALLDSRISGAISKQCSELCGNSPGHKPAVASPGSEGMAFER